MKVRIFLLLIMPVWALGQNQLVKRWDYRFGGTDGDYFSLIRQTADSGYLLAGFSTSGTGGDKSDPCIGVDDFWIVKTDSLGIKQWDKTFGGSLDEQLGDFQQTLDGGYMLGGYTSSGISGDVTSAPVGYNDYWIVKTDAAGNKLWDKRYGGTTANQLKSLHQTTDNGYILGGWSNSGVGGNKTQPSWGQGDYWIVKIDSMGNQEWDKRFGGTLRDELTTVRQTYDGGYILGGWSLSQANGDKTDTLRGGTWSDYWIVRTDTSGNKLWDKSFGGSGQDNLISTKETSDKGFILLGWSTSGISGDKTQASYGQMDYWLIKTDSLGNKLWDKTFGGNDMEDAVGNVEETSDGGFLLSGTSYSPLSGNKSESNMGIEQAWIVKTDMHGNKQWDKTIFTNGHDEVGYGIQSNDGCYVIGNYGNAGVGGYRTQGNQGGEDYWFAKFCDTSSVPNMSFSSSNTVLCETDCIDFYNQSPNNATSWMWLFPGSDSASSTQQNPAHICYHSSGQFDVTLIECNGPVCDTLVLHDYITRSFPPNVTITQSNDTLFANTQALSYQWYTIDSGAIQGATSQFIVANRTTDYSVHVTDSIGCTGVAHYQFVVAGIETTQLNKISLYPNPSNGEIIISSQDRIVNLTISDMSGRLLLNQKSLSGESPVSIANLEDGEYIVRIESDKGVYFNKLFVLRHYSQH